MIFSREIEDVVILPEEQRSKLYERADTWVKLIPGEEFKLRSPFNSFVPVSNPYIDISSR